MSLQRVCRLGRSPFGHDGRYPVKREFGKIQISVNLDEELQRGI